MTDNLHNVITNNKLSDICPCKAGFRRKARGVICFFVCFVFLKKNLSNAFVMNKNQIHGKSRFSEKPQFDFIA